MSRITVTIPHQLTRPQVKRRLEQHVTHLQRQHAGTISQVHQEWTGNSCTFSLRVLGSRVSGSVNIADQFVRITLTLPWVFSFWSGRVKRQIETEGRQLLSADS